jgi:hypothetical protein
VGAVIAGFLLWLVQGTAPLPASGVRLGVTVQPAVALVGAPVTMTVRVQVAPTTRVIFPATVDSTGPIEPLDPVLLRDSIVAGVREYTAVYRLLAWQVGRLVIPITPLRVEFGTRTQTLTLGGPVVTVQSVLPADTTLHTPRSARDILALPGGRWAWWWVLLSAAVLAVSGGWWLQRRSRRSRPPAVAPIIAADRAFAALDALALPAIGEAGRHMIVAAAILRTYLAACDPAWSASLTTAELARALTSRTDVPGEAVVALLSAVDAMQYAGGDIDAVVASALAREARSLIETIDRAPRAAEGA